VAIGATLAGGGSVVLRRRFSARHFWSDIARWDCTLFQYIGELCRYLVNAPSDPQERAHRLRLCCGNGLRPDVWDRFKQRFAIPRILEFYASTEGNFSLCNHEGEPGSIGRIPNFLAHRIPVALIKLDDATGEPSRGADGLYKRCDPGEAGEAIGQILGDRPATRFEGYTDARASERKVLRDVFEKGDAWLRTGDLMRKDSRGFFYFVDRAGDSYRWKGENVSATEVAETIAACPGVVQAVAYGVAVPGTEGRAGMAAIVPGQDFALTVLHRHLAERLPSYARPLFLRLCERIEATATFKPRTAELARDGFDPAATCDAFYFDSREHQEYLPLDPLLHDRIERGEIAL
jgi:fatty-acyl-CoA synthase